MKSYPTCDRLDDEDIAEHTGRMWRDFKRKEYRKKFDTNKMPRFLDKQDELRAQNRLIENLKRKFIERYGQDRLNEYVANWMRETCGFELGSNLFEKPALIDFFEAESKGLDPFKFGIDIGNKKK